jgi:hypothetical protein
MTTPRIAAEKAEKAQPDTRKCVLSPRHHRAIKLTKHRCDFETMFNIVVGVGPKQKTFTVYNDVIIPRSEFFRAARSNTWIKDDPARPTSLEHEDPETFAAYLHAVNYDRIRIEGLHVYETGYFEENAAFVEDFSKRYATTPFEVLHLLKSTEPYLRLMKLYILSNMLLDHHTANLAVDEVIRTRDLVMWLPFYYVVELLYDSTTAGDGMRNLVCDYFVANPKHSALKNYDWPADFMKNLVIAFMRDEELHGDVRKQEPSYPARYCANWKPSQGQHRYHTGPGTEGEESAGSSDRGHREKR